MPQEDTNLVRIEAVRRVMGRWQPINVAESDLCAGDLAPDGMSSATWLLKAETVENPRH